MADGLATAQIQDLLARHGTILLALTTASIRHRLQTGAKPRIDLAGFAPELTVQGASFITLSHGGTLRGCIGTVEACRPLALDVAENAVASAFEDPRFSAVSAAEIDNLGYQVSVLTAPAPITVAGEADLLAQLRPGQDGIILRDGEKRAVFLPQVWDLFAAPTVFMAELRGKAGLAIDHWSPTLRIFRFEALSTASAGFDLGR